MGKLSIPAIMVLLRTISYGADQAWFELTGFSSDGGYVMWETGGVQDGSGFPWVRMEVINTSHGETVEVFSQVWEDPESIPPDLSLADRKRSDLFIEFGIEPGNTGDPLVLYPVTDLTARSDTVRFCYERYYPGYNSGELGLVVHTAETEAAFGYPDWFPPPVNLTLELIINGTSSTVFSEASPAEGYGIFYGYGIAGIWKNPFVDSSLIIALHGEKPGFEGADGRFRVVAISTGFTVNAQ